MFAFTVIMVFSLVTGIRCDNLENESRIIDYFKALREELRNHSGGKFKASASIGDKLSELHTYELAYGAPPNYDAYAMFEKSKKWIKKVKPGTPELIEEFKEYIRTSLPSLTSILAMIEHRRLEVKRGKSVRGRLHK